MKRIYHKYEIWEDWKHGLYACTTSDDPLRVEQSRELLRNPQELKEAMEQTVSAWPIASEVNLSHAGRNRQAWLGQAACCLRFGSPWHLTVQGWRQLTDVEQDAANAVADEVIAAWEAGCQSGQSELTF